MRNNYRLWWRNGRLLISGAFFVPFIATLMLFFLFGAIVAGGYKAGWNDGAKSQPWHDMNNKEVCGPLAPGVYNVR